MPNPDSLGERVAPEGQLDPRRPAGRPYFEPAGARVLKALTRAELERQRQDTYHGIAQPGETAARYSAATEADGLAATDELERALDGVTALLGPAVTAGLAGAPLTGRDELRQQTPGRLERIRSTILDLAARLDHATHRLAVTGEERDRLELELERAQAAYDTDRDLIVRLERETADLEVLDYWRELAELTATALRQYDRRRSGDARSAGRQLTQLRREAQRRAAAYAEERAAR